MEMKKTRMLWMLVVCAVFAVSGCAFAADVEKVTEFEKDITFIVPFNPGAASDAYAQIIKQVGEKYINHSIILDYKPGGNTSVGTNFMLARPHDGYTISIPGNNPEYMVATGQADTYDENSYVAIGSTVSEQALLIVPASSPFRTLDEVLDFCRKNPGKLNWGGANMLGYNHFFALQTMKNGEVEFNYVPYDNAGEVMIAVLGKNVDVGSVNSSTALPYYTSGEVRVIAQGLPQRHMATLPDVPTVYETPGLEYEKYGTPFITTRSMITPADVPPEMLKAWDKLIQKVIADPVWLEWIEKRHVLPEDYMDSEKCTAFMRRNTEIIRKVYQELQASAEKK